MGVGSPLAREERSTLEGKRKNETHESTTDPDARLWTKSGGSEAKLSYMGHVMMENRNGLFVETFLTEANGRAERDAVSQSAQIVGSPSKGKQSRCRLHVAGSRRSPW